MRNYNFVTTLTGGYLNLEQPSPDSINLHDIAVGLTNVCRFSGQLPTHYSVAAHSLALAECFSDPAEKVYALLHDASEAYITDVPSPVKRLCPAYIAVEESVMDAVFEHFDLWEIGAHYHKCSNHIHTMDKMMSCLEQVALLEWRAPTWATDALAEQYGSDYAEIHADTIKYIKVLANKPSEDIHELYTLSVLEAINNYEQTKKRAVPF